MNALFCCILKSCCFLPCGIYIIVTVTSTISDDKSIFLNKHQDELFIFLVRTQRQTIKLLLLHMLI